MPVWKQRRSTTINMICGQANCYSNCHLDYTSNIPHDLNGFFKGLGLCDKCDHSLWNHHRSHAIWEQGTNTPVDQNTEEWDLAKDRTEKKAVLVAVREKVVHGFDQIISGATSDLGRQVERYAHLSLSGSFSAQVGSAVRLLEQNYTGLLEKGVGQDHLQRVEESLVNMRRKLKILQMARDKAREERVEVGQR